MESNRLLRMLKNNNTSSKSTKYLLNKIIKNNKTFRPLEHYDLMPKNTAKIKNKTNNTINAIHSLASNRSNSCSTLKIIFTTINNKHKQVQYLKKTLNSSKKNRINNTVNVTKTQTNKNIKLNNKIFALHMNTNSINELTHIPLNTKRTPNKILVPKIKNIHLKKNSINKSSFRSNRSSTKSISPFKQEINSITYNKSLNKKTLTRGSGNSSKKKYKNYFLVFNKDKINSNAANNGEKEQNKKHFLNLKYNFDFNSIKSRRKNNSIINLTTLENKNFITVDNSRTNNKKSYYSNKNIKKRISKLENNKSKSKKDINNFNLNFHNIFHTNTANTLETTNSNSLKNQVNIDSFSSLIKSKKQDLKKNSDTNPNRSINNKISMISYLKNIQNIFVCLNHLNQCSPMIKTEKIKSLKIKNKKNNNQKNKKKRRLLENNKNYLANEYASFSGEEANNNPSKILNKFLSSSPYQKNNNFSCLKIILLSNCGSNSKIGLDNFKLILRNKFTNESEEFLNYTINYKNCKIIDTTTKIILCYDKQNKKNDSISYRPSSNNNQNYFKVNQLISSPIIELKYQLHNQNNNLSLDLEIYNYSGEDITIRTKYIKIVNEGIVLYKGILNKNNSEIFKLLNINNFLDIHHNNENFVDKSNYKDKNTNNKKQSKDNKINRINSEYHRVNNYYFDSLSQRRENDTINYCQSSSNKNINENNNYISKIIKIVKLAKKKPKSSKQKINYIKCSKIKIILMSNFSYNNSIQVFGLTGLQIYNYNKVKKKEEIYNINDAKTVGALPKDLNTYFNLPKDQRIFENLFNEENNTYDENNMWLTYFDKENKKYPVIEITFQNEGINLTKIKFFNWNSPNDLEKGVNFGKLLLYENDENLIKEANFYLHIGIGEVVNYNNDGIDYSQDIKYPFQSEEFSEEEINAYNKIESIIKLNLDFQYITPYLPIGKLIKFQLYDNYGNENFIGLNSIKLYDQLGNEIKKISKKLFIPPISSKFIENRKEYIFPFIDVKKNILDKCNTIYFYLEKIKGVSFINIENYSKEDFMGNNNEEIGVKNLKIFIEEKIVFEGQLFKGKMSTVLFSSNQKIMNKINKQNLLLTHKFKENKTEIIINYV